LVGGWSRAGPLQAARRKCRDEGKSAGQHREIAERKKVISSAQRNRLVKVVIKVWRLKGKKAILENGGKL